MLMSFPIGKKLARAANSHRSGRLPAKKVDDPRAESAMGQLGPWPRVADAPKVEVTSAFGRRRRHDVGEDFDWRSRKS